VEEEERKNFMDLLETGDLADIEVLCISIFHLVPAFVVPVGIFYDPCEKEILSTGLFDQATCPGMSHMINGSYLFNLPDIQCILIIKFFTSYFVEPQNKIYISI
jgi:hypothetical protein